MLKKTLMKLLRRISLVKPHPVIKAVTPPTHVVNPNRNNLKNALKPRLIFEEGTTRTTSINVGDKYKLPKVECLSWNYKKLNSHLKVDFGALDVMTAGTYMIQYSLTDPQTDACITELHLVIVEK